MNRVPLVISGTTLSVEQFWNSVLLYHNRPNLVNRKLTTVAQISLSELLLSSSNIKHISDMFRWEALLYEIRKFQDLTAIASSAFIKDIVEIHDKTVQIIETSWTLFSERFDGIFVSLRVLLARHKNERCLEVVIFDKTNRTATFFAIQELDHLTLAPRFPYHLVLSQDATLKVMLNAFEDADTASAEWLADKLFPKLLKWASDNVEEKGIQSLELVVASEYCTLYAELKSKYTGSLLKVWSSKANTDPKKYIFEDIAIAAYLICLWCKIETKNINFVDCGCGNGLLVYILNQEGFKGCGLDVRSREIWEIYGDKADLRVAAVTPMSVFPEATWIIGNHSDELTPWIPVIALKSHPKTNFFVLPCCPYDFNGRKYIRHNTGLSQYNDYLNYMQDVSNKCGFTTLIDKLRIPSTKRTCLVGLRKSYTDLQLTEINSEAEHFIGVHTSSIYKTRNPVEEVRNCTQLNVDLKNRIINLAVSSLLATTCNVLKLNSQLWNKGGTVTVENLSKIVPKDDLILLKSQCKGLQTLIKNYRYIFDVQKGIVCLRIPPTIMEIAQYKAKPCWFHKNHPDGCLHENESCAYKHVEKI